MDKSQSEAFDSLGRERTAFKPGGGGSTRRVCLFLPPRRASDETPMQDERLERSLVHQSAQEDGEKERRHEGEKGSRCCDLSARQ